MKKGRKCVREVSNLCILYCVLTHFTSVNRSSMITVTFLWCPEHLIVTKFELLFTWPDFLRRGKTFAKRATVWFQSVRCRHTTAPRAPVLISPRGLLFAGMLSCSICSFDEQEWGLSIRYFYTLYSIFRKHGNNPHTFISMQTDSKFNCIIHNEQFKYT